MDCPRYQRVLDREMLGDGVDDSHSFLSLATLMCSLFS